MGFGEPRFGERRSVSRTSISTKVMFYTVNNNKMNRVSIFPRLLFITGCYTFCSQDTPPHQKNSLDITPITTIMPLIMAITGSEEGSSRTQTVP